MATDPLAISTDGIAQMREYIQRRLIRRPGVQITDDTTLVSSGLIDSFALIEIFLKLEEITNRKIPASKVQPRDMDTVRLMFATAARIGKVKQQSAREPSTLA